MRWVLDVLRKHSLFANLKKCYFYKNKICFLSYVVSTQKIRIKGKRIEAIRNWLEPKSIKDIQIFLDFANFYHFFILSSMLNTLSNPSGSQSGKIADKVNDEVLEGGNRSGVTAFMSKKLKNTKSKNSTYM